MKERLLLVLVALVSLVLIIAAILWSPWCWLPYIVLGVAYTTVVFGWDLWKTDAVAALILSVFWIYHAASGAIIYWFRQFRNKPVLELLGRSAGMHW